MQYQRMTSVGSLYELHSQQTFGNPSPIFQIIMDFITYMYISFISSGNQKWGHTALGSCDSTSRVKFAYNYFSSIEWKTFNQMDFTV
jgi:hypothetical protein